MVLFLGIPTSDTLSTGKRPCAAKLLPLVVELDLGGYRIRTVMIVSPLVALVVEQVEELMCHGV